jgi:hypothetical protein
MRHIIATLAASGGSAISLQIAESLKLKQLEVNLEDSVSVHTSLKLFVQIFVQPPRKFSDVQINTNHSTLRCRCAPRSR